MTKRRKGRKGKTKRRSPGVDPKTVVCALCGNAPCDDDGCAQCKAVRIPSDIGEVEDLVRFVGHVIPAAAADTALEQMAVSEGWEKRVWIEGGAENGGKLKAVTIPEEVKAAFGAA